MTTAYTSLLGLALPVTGELSGTWGDTVNNSITSLLDSAISGTTTISADADITLTTTTGAANEAREAIILWTAGGTVTRNITAPAQSKTYIVINKSSSTQSIVLRGAGPTTGVTIIKGESAVCAWNGSDFIKVSNISGPGTFTDLTVTGVASFADGTAALPSITNTGDTNTGIFFPAADTIAFSEGGAEAMRLDSSGNVGIGTASPTVKLQVTTASAAALPASSGTTLSVGTLIRLGSSADAAGNIGTIGLATNQMWIQATDQTNLAVSYQLLLNPNGGNVGIGTASPAYKLDVAGAISTNNNLTFTGTGNRITGDFSNATFANRVALQTSTTNGNTSVNVLPNGTSVISAVNVFNNSDPTNAGIAGIVATNTDGRLQAGITGTGTYLPLTFYTNGSERVRIDTSGNVGIGTSSPVSLLQVGSTATSNNTLTVASANNTAAQIDLLGDTSATVGTNLKYEGNGNFFAISSTNAGTLTERMRIDSSGNVGIGNTNPGVKLQVTGTTIASNFYTGTGTASAGTFGADSAGTGASIIMYGSTGANPGAMILSAGSSERMRIDSSGNVLIGTTSQIKSSKQSVYSGATNATTYNTASFQGGSVLTVQNQQTTSVSTSAVTIATTGIYASLAIVFGSDGTNRFQDLVMFSIGTGTVNVINSLAVSGTPSSRTYSQSSSTYRLAMGSGTYTIQFSGLSQGD
jgi:hypothetical protein